LFFEPWKNESYKSVVVINLQIHPLFNYKKKTKQQQQQQQRQKNKQTNKQTKEYYPNGKCLKLA